MTKKLLYIFTRTPLHVGAGSSVGAIDQPIQRERHTGFPIIPASSLKGTFADAWNGELIQEEENGTSKKVRVGKDGQRSEAAWLFGADKADFAAAGAVQFSEAKLLAFPIRSARGSFAWITSPLILRRAARDGVIPAKASAIVLKDDQAIFSGDTLGFDVKAPEPKKQIVLEEYTFDQAGNGESKDVASALKNLMAEDPVWSGIESRLVILSDGMMSFFSQNACEVAQHVRIDDETGTAAGGALFNQENVPSETLFYSVVTFSPERAPRDNGNRRGPNEAVRAFQAKLESLGSVFQFGGDASTGLGYCTVKFDGGTDAKP
jgi:CRISPR-associated protein Cmr4